MASLTINPYGLHEITVPAGESIAISNYGGGIAKIYYLIEDPNRPNIYKLQQTLNNSAVTLGAFAAGKKIKIEANRSTVIYEVASSPSPNPYALDAEVVHLTGAESVSGKIFTGDVTMNADFILAYGKYIRGKDSGGTNRTVFTLNGNEFTFGGNAYPVNTLTDGTLKYNNATLASGSIDTTATQTITVVDGLITSIA